MSQDFCCHCKHLLGKRHAPENVEAWRCYNPANIQSKGFNLVTGAQLTEYVCENIVVARGTQDKCMGFELYEPPTYNVAAQSIDSTSQVTNLSRLAKLKSMRSIGVNDL